VLSAPLFVDRQYGARRTEWAVEVMTSSPAVTGTAPRTEGQQAIGHGAQ
jgi:hypothetical protein